MDIRKLANENELEKLVLASAFKARQENKHSLKFLLKKSISTPTSADDIKQCVKNLNLKDFDKKMSSNEALALMLSTDISKRSYQYLRNISLRKRANIYPAYNNVRKAKELCCPKNISVEETKCEVELENLLHHTLYRVLEVKSVEENVKKVLGSKINDNNFNGVFQFKWGFDGATGQSEYKQMFTQDLSYSIPGNCLFSTTLVPLGIHFHLFITYKILTNTTLFQHDLPRKLEIKMFTQKRVSLCKVIWSSAFFHVHFCCNRV